MNYPKFISEIISQEILLWVLCVTYVLQLLALFSELPELAAKSKLQLILFLTPFMLVFGCIACVFVGAYLLIKKVIYLPNKTPSNLSDDVTEAFGILFKSSYKELPLLINHKNTLVREFSKDQLKGTHLNP